MDVGAYLFGEGYPSPIFQIGKWSFINPEHGARSEHDLLDFRQHRRHFDFNEIDKTEM